MNVYTVLFGVSFSSSDNLKILEMTEDPQNKIQLLTKPKSNKPPLVRTSNVSEITLNKPQTKTNAHHTYSVPNTHLRLSQMPLNSYAGADSCRKGWSLVRPQLTRTNHWHNPPLGQMDPMISHGQISLNGMAHQTTYWQPAYQTLHTTPHPQAYSSQSNLCQGMQNLHFAFTSIPMNMNSQYPLGESLQYQPIHSTKPDFIHGNFSYDSHFHDGQVDTRAFMNSPKKTESQKSPKRSRLAAKFHVPIN